MDIEAYLSVFGLLSFSEYARADVCCLADGAVEGRGTALKRRTYAERKNNFHPQKVTR